MKSYRKELWFEIPSRRGFVNITPDGKFVGDAAESWQMSPDGLLYSFKLRKNVLFHDGTPVDAAAVKFSIDRLRDPATKSGMRAFYEPVQSVENPEVKRLYLGYDAAVHRPPGDASGAGPRARARPESG